MQCLAIIPNKSKWRLIARADLSEAQRFAQWGSFDYPQPSFTNYSFWLLPYR